MREAFRQFCKRVHDVTDEEIDAVVALFEPLQLSPREYILKEGQMTDKLFFITRGHFRSYCVKDGEEFTTNFYFAPTLYGDVTAMMEGRPTIFNLQCYDEAEVYHVRKIDFEALGDRYPNLLHLIVRFFEIIYAFGVKRQLSFIYHTAEERYLNLFNERPKVISEIPLTHIATYLGVKPESLSRIRRKYQQKMQSK